ncbi:MAG TPA: hypothetical protein DCM07_02870 [Planctomycetaceae bacterium]|nr:hypothetical protein [Planctomycetaceae bacterium]
MLVTGRLRRAFDTMGILLLSDLNGNRFQTYLASLRKKGRSQQTCKHIVRHAKQFANFLLEDERIETDPFRKVRPIKVSERCHQRRALTSEECTKLLKAARKCSPLYGLSGPDQEVLFLVALNTGFRATELSHMEVANLQLADEYPHISLSASQTKNRDEARIPLRDPGVVQFLKAWIAGKPRSAKLWPGNWAKSRGGGKMIKPALEAAEIPYEVDGRKADFHALRYTFITNLIKAGETPAYVQRLARHSDINLTYRVYSDLGLEDLYHGMLRSRQTPHSQTGESQENSLQEQGDKSPDDQPDDSNSSESVAQNVAHFSDSEGLSSSSDVTGGDKDDEDSRPQKDKHSTPQSQKATGDNSSCRSMSQQKQKRRGGDSPPGWFQT